MTEVEKKRVFIRSRTTSGLLTFELGKCAIKFLVSVLNFVASVYFGKRTFERAVLALQTTNKKEKTRDRVFTAMS